MEKVGRASFGGALTRQHIGPCRSTKLSECRAGSRESCPRFACWYALFGGFSFSSNAWMYRQAHLWLFEPGFFHSSFLFLYLFHAGGLGKTGRFNVWSAYIGLHVGCQYRNLYTASWLLQDRVRFRGSVDLPKSEAKLTEVRTVSTSAKLEPQLVHLSCQVLACVHDTLFTDVVLLSQCVWRGTCMELFCDDCSAHVSIAIRLFVLCI